MRAAPEGHAGGRRTVEITTGDRLDAAHDMRLQRLSGFDLVAGDPNVHLNSFQLTRGGTSP